MGANFETMTVPATKTRAEVKAAFERAQEDDRYENGHIYSGGFGMASGLDFPGETFGNEEEAVAWLQSNAQKWEEVLAVLTPDNWVIDALCAS